MLHQAKVYALRDANIIALRTEMEVREKMASILENCSIRAYSRYVKFLADAGYNKVTN